ncbi:MAG: hypothetical protein JNK64_33275 [Myxococcales bacterium]|nr:hypothetical protein [Myxococcales bacterium]
MCCFSRPIPFVGGTKIFGRVDGDRQWLAYSMDFAAREALAMVLPLPVPAGTPEDAVRFVDLSGYRTFFADVERAFPVFLLPAAKGGPAFRGAIPARPRLKVHEVGDFVASFVPTSGDFDRLDPRFRLAPEVVAALAAQRDYGFAVVQLAATGAGWWRRLWRKVKSLAPVALSFPTRDPGRVFFPTVHVHDGVVHDQAAFDHMLYWQGGPPEGDPLVALGQPMSASGPLGRTVDAARARGLIDPDAPARRRVLVGRLPNRDQWIDLAPPTPADAAA